MKNIIGGPALPMDRYHLRAPIFPGEKDVEQFIAESMTCQVYSDPAAVVPDEIGQTLRYWSGYQRHL